MNDLDILHDAWTTPDAPSDSAREQARADLLARTTVRTRRRWTPRLAAVGGLATALALAIVVVQNVGDGRPVVAPRLASAAVLEAAAVAAQDDPFSTPPRRPVDLHPRQVLRGRRRAPVPRGALATGRWRRLRLLRRSGKLQVEMVAPRGRRKPVPLRAARRLQAARRAPHGPRCPPALGLRPTDTSRAPARPSMRRSSAFSRAWSATTSCRRTSRPRSSGRSSRSPA